MMSGQDGVTLVQSSSSLETNESWAKGYASFYAKWLTTCGADVVENPLE